MEEKEKGSGWLLFASIMLMMVGVFNVIWGIAAVAKSTVFVADTRLVFGSLNSWGWIYLILGVIEICAGFGVLSKAQWARWFGIVVGSIAAIMAFFSIWAYPGWALLIITLDVLVVYGLAAYGGREPGAL
jgi:uncharacterized membrane protein (DUF2068 family)